MSDLYLLMLGSQNIRVDDHQAGSGQPSSLKDMHIDKIFTDKRRKGKGVKIYPVSGNIENNKLSDKDLKSVLAEIRKCLEKDPQKLKAFGEKIYDTLQRWSSGKIEVSEAQNCARRVAENLGLKAKIIEGLVKIVDDQVVELVTTHADNAGRFYWLRFRVGRFDGGSGALQLRNWNFATWRFFKSFFNSSGFERL